MKMVTHFGTILKIKSDWRELFMEFKDYIREIELIQKQNYVEQDLYSVIASVMRERENIKKLSLRDISNRRRTGTNNEKEKIFYGIDGFPDFVVLSEDFVANDPCKEKVFGAIEIKYADCYLKDIKDNMQLKGHILWFNKVLYTNGLEWKYYEYFPADNNLNIIKKLQNNMYNWRKNSNYKFSEYEKKLLKSLDHIEPKWSVHLKDETFHDNNWNELIKKLSEIDWTALS